MRKFTLWKILHSNFFVLILHLNKWLLFPLMIFASRAGRGFYLQTNREGEWGDKTSAWWYQSTRDLLVWVMLNRNIFIGLSWKGTDCLVKITLLQKIYILQDKSLALKCLQPHVALNSWTNLPTSTVQCVDDYVWVSVLSMSIERSWVSGCDCKSGTVCSHCVGDGALLALTLCVWVYFILPGRTLRTFSYLQ